MSVCESQSDMSNSLQPHGLYSPSGFSVHGILQAGILEWVPIHFSRGSSPPRDGTWVSCIAGRFFTIWAPKKVQYLNMSAYMSKYMYRETVRDRMRGCRKIFRRSLCVYVIFPRAYMRKRSESYEIIKCRNILLREMYARKKIKKKYTNMWSPWRW